MQTNGLIMWSKSKALLNRISGINSKNTEGDLFNEKDAQS
jgi:hypothetical protein